MHGREIAEHARSVPHVCPCEYCMPPPELFTSVHANCMRVPAFLDVHGRGGSQGDCTLLVPEKRYDFEEGTTYEYFATCPVIDQPLP